MYVRHGILLYVMDAIQVRIQRVLTSVLLAALRAYDEGVLAAKMHVFDMPLEAHFVEVFVAMRTTFTGASLLITRPTRTIGCRTAVIGLRRRRRRRRI